jgi:transcriptional regulator with XRE-family HTH domain
MLCETENCTGSPNIEQKTAYYNSMEEEIRLSIGARMREERERLGLSQSAFAELGGVSLRAEQDWERGVSSPKADFLAVAVGHGVDVFYVLTGQRISVTTNSLSEEERGLLENYRRSDEEGKRAARRVLSSLAQLIEHRNRTWTLRRKSLQRYE